MQLSTESILKLEKRKNTVSTVTVGQFRQGNVITCKSGWNTRMKCLSVYKECQWIHMDRVPSEALFHMCSSAYRKAVKKKCTCNYLQPLISVI